MSQIAGVNPWVSMWSHPRDTIRAIVFNKPSYGVYYLATIFSLQSFFFYANWWSLGLKNHFSFILTLAIIFSPLIGLFWVFISGYIYYLTGRLLKGEAPSCHLRAAVAWSKIPTSINLLMWLVLIFMSPDFVFIQDGGGPSSIFINLISLILGIWSLVLLIQSIREVQHFSLGRSILNVFLASIVSFILFVAIFALIRSSLI